MDLSILAALERAELAARERQLAAAAQADQILEAARADARVIAAGVEARIASALAEDRAEALGRAEEETRRIETEIEALDIAPTADTAWRARIERAAERIVAAVLAENEG